MRGVRALGWVWTMRKSPETLLKLLIYAQSHHTEHANLARAFRAGVEIGRKYPAVVREHLDHKEEWSI